MFPQGPSILGTWYFSNSTKPKKRYSLWLFCNAVVDWELMMNWERASIRHKAEGWLLDVITESYTQNGKCLSKPFGLQKFNSTCTEPPVTPVFTRCFILGYSSVPCTISFVRSPPKAKRKLTSTHRKYSSWPKNFVWVFRKMLWDNSNEPSGQANRMNQSKWSSWETQAFDRNISRRHHTGFRTRACLPLLH